MNPITTENIHQLKDGRYIIKKGNHRQYGVFPTLEYAREFERICNQHNWDDIILTKLHLLFQTKTYYKNKYITSQSGKYNIVKTINGHPLSYGRFEDIQSARSHRDKCIKYDWDPSLRLINYTRSKKTVTGEKYISQIGGKFLVQKNINGKYVRFDLCNTLDEAIECRDFWVQCGWDWNCIDLT